MFMPVISKYLVNNKHRGKYRKLSFLFFLLSYRFFGLVLIWKCQALICFMHQVLVCFLSATKARVNQR